jgi:AraC-like DNA-binding protein/mannose-6-phosphate isomerase-like protein (cupin superfamily)
LGNEIRLIEYDADCKVEAYQFEGVMQKFPKHFHNHYVVGFIEKGKRYLYCGNRQQTIEPGDLLLFGPHDCHACEQADAQPLDYRCINIQPEVMCNAAEEITSCSEPPIFKAPVVFHSELIPLLRELHQMIMRKEHDFHKEEIFFFFMKQLLEDHTLQKTPDVEAGSMDASARICAHLERNYAKAITLDELSKIAGLSKYHMLRLFTKEKGISPYSYLETIRIDHAKMLLQQGVSPINVAMETGFADQSHFCNFFKKFIGLTPAQYRDIFRNSGQQRSEETQGEIKDGTTN